ncbi:hypothetical protein [Acanthopleuribacter pedis]|uniref:Uncharacterized protein n=1 Tax=Acanthopleuribacter pedis TaxID=442870 RepID=A0A8J7QB59_9BACT|nr:hypothetical protein [Acanthopleuribacter pedis]MBO1321222.1 hypothetical protein [Acanthopleuribacter pedis]
MNKKACLFSCLGCGGILSVVLVAMGILTYQTFQQMSEGFTSPGTVASSVLADGETYPPGYAAVVGFGIPFSFDFIMMGEVQTEIQTEDPFEKLAVSLENTDPSLTLLKMKGAYNDPQLESFLKDGSQSSFHYAQFNVLFHADDQAQRGFFGHGSGEILYLSTNGRVVLSGEQGSTLQGAYTLFYSKCSDGRAVLGLWFDQRAPDEVVEGGPVDPNAFREMVAYFSFCP